MIVLAIDRTFGRKYARRCGRARRFSRSITPERPINNPFPDQRNMTSAKIDDSELENVESLTAVVQEITEGMKLIDLVTSLGVHLTNEDGKIRGKGLF